MTAPESFRIDRQAVRKHFGRRAAQCDAVDSISREIASRMAERLDYVRLSPQCVLDLGCGIGADREALARRYPEALQLGVDFAVPALARQMPAQRGLLGRVLSRSKAPRLAAADALSLPLRPASVDMIWSNLMLNWLDDPLPALREMNRVLRVDGVVMFSTLGPDTLKELRAALPSTSVHRFIDMHDIGDALVSAGFGDPVMDMQMLQVTYRSSDDLLRDLRLGGHVSADAARPRGLRSPAQWRNTLARLEEQRRDGVIPTTLEVVFGHAWKSLPKADADGNPIIRFERKPAA